MIVVSYYLYSNNLQIESHVVYFVFRDNSNYYRFNITSTNVKTFETVAKLS